MLTQMDITTDGFGYMLSFGDLVWVPFTYGIQARYLAFHPVDLGLTASAAIVALNVIGFYIFRTSNSDKDSFRKHNNPKSRSRPWDGTWMLIVDFEYLQTERGTKLMTSGWWGRSRHPNYFGDWLMASVSFCSVNDKG
jgi:delta14-sterol reductase